MIAPNGLPGWVRSTIVTGFTDADGTVRDAGYMPRLTKGFGW